MIGAKTLSSLGLLIIVATLVWFRGAASLDYLQQLDPAVATLIGLFAALLGTLVVRFFGLNKKSVTRFRVTSKERRFDAEITFIDSLGGKITVGEDSTVAPADLPPAVQRLIYIAIFLGVGLMTLNNRTFALLGEFKTRLSASSSRFCEEAIQEPPPQGPEARGCALVQRAFELGYAKDLGACAPRENKDKNQELCTLRLSDEPYLHYAWRQLYDRGASVIQLFHRDNMVHFKEQLEHRVAHLDSLYSLQKAAVTASPRASHHLWTNLPHPRQAFLDHTRDYVVSGLCAAQNSTGADRMNLAQSGSSTSHLVEQSLGQLALSPSWQPTVGRCEEYVIHWGAPSNACEQLATNPIQFLVDSDVIEPIWRLLERYQTESELMELALIELPSSKGASNSPERIVSFQCFIEDELSEPQTTATSLFDIAGFQFQAVESRFRPFADGPGHAVEVYRQLAGLLATGFHYDSLASKKSLTHSIDPDSVKTLFTGSGFMLSRAEYLREMDLFLSNSWLAERPDLLEVYPYHLHLTNFVEVFRRHYRQQRGRL